MNGVVFWVGLLWGCCGDGCAMVSFFNDIEVVFNGDVGRDNQLDAGEYVGW